MAWRQPRAPAVTGAFPACYHESLGLDLADVATRTGLSVAEVAERHSGAVHHVYMMGFLPGLPYIGGLPPEFGAAAAREPAHQGAGGAIAVAMAMTVIYPLESPGGWHILARTPAPLWDMRRDPPALLSAGDKVVFDPISLGEYEALLAQAAAGDLRLAPEPPSRARRMTAALRVVAPGLMTTLQDLGRPGYQHLGIPISGALDR